MRKQLSELELADFDHAPVWIPDFANCDDETVMPVDGKAQIVDGDTSLWIRFVGRLADGTAISGIAMAEAEPGDLLAWSFFIEGEWLALHFPPAPEFVLRETGPHRLALSLGRPMPAVFPIRIQSEVPLASSGEPIRQVITEHGASAAA
jgi:hypothetical protein